MRLAAKLSLLLGCAVTVPLVLVLAVLLPRGSAALQSQLKQLFAQDARALALECQKTVLDDLEALSLAARTLRLPELDAETRQQALLLLYKETRGADVLGLFDEKGNAVVPSVRFATLGSEAAEHETVSELGMVAYSHHVPLDAALETGLAIGPVYALPDGAGEVVPRVVLAAKVPGEKWVLAMELSLRPVLRSVLGFKAGQSGEAFLVDTRNHVIAHHDRVLVRDRTPISPAIRCSRRGRRRTCWAPRRARRFWDGRWWCKSRRRRRLPPCVGPCARRRSGWCSRSFSRWSPASSRCGW